MIDPEHAFRTIESQLEPDGRIKARWHVPVDLPYFSGHFPGSPIFPAVGIVDATLQTLRTQLKNPSLQLAGIPSAKFMSPIVPEQNVILELSPTGPGEWQAEWKDSHPRPDGSKLLASLSLRCRG
jgi:3-hydroxymyristoyl/3-hydroxydecanoyl-(acyl carrier protein) dehydratase